VNAVDCDRSKVRACCRRCISLGVASLELVEGSLVEARVVDPAVADEPVVAAHPAALNAMTVSSIVIGLVLYIALFNLSDSFLL